MGYIDFNDNNIPIGKRKQAYVKYALSKGTSRANACRQANSKFGFELKPKTLFVFNMGGDPCRYWIDDIVNTKKYEHCACIYKEDYDPAQLSKTIDKYKASGWLIVERDLIR